MVRTNRHSFRCVIAQAGRSLVSCSAILFIGQSLAIAQALPPNAPEFIPGRYIVILKEAAPAEGVSPAVLAMSRRPGVALQHVYSHAANGFAADLNPAALNQLMNDPRVAHIEQDQIVRINQKKPPGGGGTQPPQSVPWGIIKIGVDTDRPDGVDVDVAIIDTGIDKTHPDLNVSGGANYAGGSPTNHSDGNGHGTHVAGTVAARNNAIGVVGVAPGARLWAVRVLGNSGSGTLSGVIAGVDWVKANAGTIEVANMSLGSGHSDALNSAIDSAVAAGVTFVVAAGNNASDTRGYSPANSSSDGVITVSAMSGNGVFASFSNNGLNYLDDVGAKNGVDVIAPGVGVLSTYKGATYATLSGTSMASPHVAGVAALSKVLNPGLSPADVKDAVMTSAPGVLFGSGGYYASPPWAATTGDLDGYYEPLVYAAAFYGN